MAEATFSRAVGIADESLVNGEMDDVHMDNGDGSEAATAPALPLDVFSTATATAEPDADREAVEGEDFFDPQDSVSTASNAETDGGNGSELLLRTPRTPMGEYYDACEEVSSEAATQSSWRYIENELHEVRLNLSMEIEKRKQAEEALGNLHKLWQSMSHRLSFVGLMLPPPPAIITEDKGSTSLDVDPVENLGQQLLISKLVVESIGRACSRAEIQLEMEPLINAKKFEIARLWDRLQYYESANREMSQRNQEAVDMARQQRNKRKRRQKWIWRSVGLTISLGAAAIIWSYLPSSSSSSTKGKNEGIRALD